MSVGTKLVLYNASKVLMITKYKKKQLVM